MRKSLVIVSLTTSVLTLAPAAALVDTTTRGRVCRNEPCRLETFSGGYFFRGSTRPSETGQKVVFFYKRRGCCRWHRFGTEGSNRVFVSTDGTPYDLINTEHRWREHFDVNGGFPHTRWVLKAQFLRQDGYERSSDRVRVRTVFGD